MIYLKRRNNSQNLELGGRTIGIVRKLGGRVRTGVIWLRVGTIGGEFFNTLYNEPSGSQNVGNF
jgi:hypothetical protein